MQLSCLMPLSELSSSGCSYTSLKDAPDAVGSKLSPRMASPKLSFRWGDSLSLNGSVAENEPWAVATSVKPAPVLEGWVFKRSRRLHTWRARWATLWIGSRDSFEFSAQERDYERSTESFSLGNVRSVRAVPDEHYCRPNCIVMEYLERTSMDKVTCRLVGIQLPSSGDRDHWMSMIRRTAAATFPSVAVPKTLLSSLQSRTGTSVPSDSYTSNKGTGKRVANIESLDD